MDEEGVSPTLTVLKMINLFPAIIDYLWSYDRKEREVAVIALGLLGDPEAHRTIIGCLSDADPFVMVAAAEGLGEIEDTGSVQLLLDALSHESSAVRRSVVDALGKIGDRRALEALAKLTGNESDRTVLWRATVALRDLQNRTSSPRCLSSGK